MQWTTEAPEPFNSPCPICGLLHFPWASEDMTTAKFRSDNGISTRLSSISSAERH